MLSKNKGFTLVELIIVIIVLAILAIVAYSRYVDFAREAQISTNKAIASTFETAVSSANLRWFMSGSPGRVQNLAVFGESVLDFNTSGWPIGLNKGSANDNIGRGNGGCTALWNYLVSSGPRAALNANSDYQAYRHTGNRHCSFVVRTNGDTAGRVSAQLGVRYNC